MSTKSIARTAIEGGRANPNKFDRRHSHSRLRTATRNFLRSFDPDAPERTPPPVLHHEGREFTDKLSPITGWFASRCGRPWNDVYSEIRQNFDVRTTAGRHIVFDHMLPTVINKYRPRAPGFRDFYIDDAGVLRRMLDGRAPWQVTKDRSKALRRAQGRAPAPGEVSEWVAGRRVGRVGVVWFWYMCTGVALGSKRVRCTAPWPGVCRHDHEPDRNGVIWYHRLANWRQDRRLDAADVAFLDRLNFEQRRGVLTPSAEDDYMEEWWAKMR